MRFNEDTLVQETTANYLRDELHWESVFAHNTEVLGKESTFGRKDETEIVLTRYLGEALLKLNPDLPDSAYQSAIREIIQATVSQSLLLTNRERYEKLRDGVVVDYRDDKGDLKKARLRIFDFDDPENNHFLAVRELWIKGVLYRRRADLIGFVTASEPATSNTIARSGAIDAGSFLKSSSAAGSAATRIRRSNRGASLSRCLAREGLTILAPPRGPALGSNSAGSGSLRSGRSGTVLAFVSYWTFYPLGPNLQLLFRYFSG